MVSTTLTTGWEAGLAVAMAGRDGRDSVAIADAVPAGWEGALAAPGEEFTPIWVRPRGVE